MFNIFSRYKFKVSYMGMGVMVIYYINKFKVSTLAGY